MLLSLSLSLFFSPPYGCSFILLFLGCGFCVTGKQVVHFLNGVLNLLASPEGGTQEEEEEEEEMEGRREG